MNKLKTIFFGTPEIACPFLEKLTETTDVALVVMQPDKPRGRKMLVSPCPVKERALELGLKVLSPEKLSDIEREIKDVKADVAFAVAYGKIFKKNTISAPRLGIINIHFSLLPQLRGAAPVQYALINGLEKTGVTAFWIDEGLDTGPLFLQKEIGILPSDNAVTLFEKLIPLGVEVMEEAVQNIERGDIIKTPQTKRVIETHGYLAPFKPSMPLVGVQEIPEPTYAPLIKKEDTFIYFSDMYPVQINDLVRGLAAGPYARFIFQNEPVLVLETSLTDCPGKSLMVKCKEGYIYLTKVRPSGKKDMDGLSFANGHDIKQGTEL